MQNTFSRYWQFDAENAQIEIGKRFADAIRASVADISLNPNFYAMKEKLAKRYPSYLREIEQRADGAGVDRDAYLFYVSFELFEASEEKCTDIFIKKPDGELLWGHNEDGPYEAGNSALVRIERPDGSWYTEYASTDAPPFSSFAFTSAGMIFSVNYMWSYITDLTEVSAWFLLRDLGESKSIEEIEAKLRGARCASGFHLNVFDTKTMRASSVEFCIDNASVVDISGAFAHSNHYLRVADESEKLKDSGNTVPRYTNACDRLRQVDTAHATITDVRRILEHSDTNYRETIHVSPGVRDGSITAAMMLVDSGKKAITVQDYIEDATLEFPFPG